MWLNGEGLKFDPPPVSWFKVTRGQIREMPPIGTHGFPIYTFPIQTLAVSLTVFKIIAVKVGLFRRSIKQSV